MARDADRDRKRDMENKYNRQSTELENTHAEIAKLLKRLDPSSRSSVAEAKDKDSSEHESKDEVWRP